MNPDTKLFFPYHGELVEPSFDGLRMICSTFLLALLLAAGLQASEAGDKGDSEKNAADAAAQNSGWKSEVIQVLAYEGRGNYLTIDNHTLFEGVSRYGFIDQYPKPIPTTKDITGILIRSFSGRQMYYVDLTPFKRIDHIGVAIHKLPKYSEKTLSNARVSIYQGFMDETQPGTEVTTLDVPVRQSMEEAIVASEEAIVASQTPPAPPAPSHSVEILAQASRDSSTPVADTPSDREQIAALQTERVALMSELREQQQDIAKIQTDIARLEASLPKPTHPKETTPKAQQSSEADTKYVFSKPEPISEKATAQQLREALAHEQKLLDAARRSFAAEEKRYQELFKQREALNFLSNEALRKK